MGLKESTWIKRGSLRTLVFLSQLGQRVKRASVYGLSTKLYLGGSLPIRRGFDFFIFRPWWSGGRLNRDTIQLCVLHERSHDAVAFCPPCAETAATYSPSVNNAFGALAIAPELPRQVENTGEKAGQRLLSAARQYGFLPFQPSALNRWLGQRLFTQSDPDDAHDAPGQQGVDQHRDER